jgi:hypothetical protein
MMGKGVFAMGVEVRALSEAVGVELSGIDLREEQPDEV